MTHQLLAVAQWINDANTALLGVEGLLFGLVLFGSLFLYVEHRARKEAGIL